MKEESTKFLHENFPKIYANKPQILCGDGWFTILSSFSKDMEKVASKDAEFCEICCHAKEEHYESEKSIQCKGCKKETDIDHFSLRDSNEFFHHSFISSWAKIAKIKEALGSLTVTFSQVPECSSDTYFSLVESLLKKSKTICELCGDSGFYTFRNRSRTRCEKCLKLESPL